MIDFLITFGVAVLVYMAVLTPIAWWVYKKGWLR